MTNPSDQTVPGSYSRSPEGQLRRTRPAISPPARGGDRELRDAETIPLTADGEPVEVPVEVVKEFVPPPPRTLAQTRPRSLQKPLSERRTKPVDPPRPTEHLRSLIDLPGHYELRRKIAAGGMGAVMMVYDKRIRREVAVKVMLRPGDHEGYRLRFVEEAQITGQLEHPNIVPIHEVGEDSIGRPFFVMKLIHGKSLAEIISIGKKAVKENRLTGLPSLRERLEVFLKVCDAIAFAHEKNVIHRDLKPDNVMVGEFGEVQVMDWGIAKVLRPGHSDPLDLDDLEPISSDRLDEGVFRTRDGSVAGTPAYMSPEQAKGEVSKLDERTDVYALGCMLYTLLTFAPPYKGKSAYDVLKKAAEGRFQKPSSRVRSEGLYPTLAVPPEMDSIIRRSMARAQNRRYRSVGDLKTDITAFLENQPVSAHRDGVWGRVSKWTKRKPAQAIGAAMSVIFVLLFMAGAGVALAMMGEQGRENERLALAEAQATAVAEREGRQRAEAERRTAEQMVRTAEEARAREKAERERERLAVQAAVQEQNLDALADQLGIELGYQRDALLAQYMTLRNNARLQGTTELAFVEALTLEDRRRYTAAFEELMAAADRDGRRYETVRDCDVLGSLYLMGEEDPVRALVVFDRGLGIDSQQVDCLYGRATALLYLDRFDEARDIADKLILQYPSDFMMWELKQNVEGMAGNTPEALRALQQAYRLCPHPTRRAHYRKTLERYGVEIPD